MAKTPAHHLLSPNFHMLGQVLPTKHIVAPKPHKASTPIHVIVKGGKK